MSSEYIIYADESDKQGRYFSNFYGGVLVRSADVETMRRRLAGIKAAENLHQEIKWGKVTANYLEKYRAVMDGFFDLVADNRIKVRIMFTQNAHVPVGLAAHQRENSYHLLYYQFIKHAFGLAYHDGGDAPVYLRIYLDNMPHTREKNEQFKGYLLGLQHSPGFRSKQLHIRAEDITEVTSHDHVLLQCLDVVLGSIQFRLNDKHREMPEGASRRGKRTIAKEALYTHILQRIRGIYPNFNIGITTGTRGNRQNRWQDAYRHWLFVPRDFQLDLTQTKGKK